jgi:PIN domain nuclease of toxin-antitoxin system
LWWLNEPRLLSDEGQAAIADRENDVFLSAASVWEAAVKEAAGRLSVPRPFAESARREGLVELGIRWEHAERAARLPALHGDPFDRILVAQAQVEKLVLVTRDPRVRAYDVATLAA